MSNTTLTDQQRKDFALVTLASLAAIRAADGNALCALDLTGKHKGDTDAIFAEAVADVINLTK